MLVMDLNLKTQKKHIENLICDDKSHSLTNLQLLATIIGATSRNECNFNIAKKILIDNNHSLAQIARLSVNQLMHYKGIGEKTAINIKTTFLLAQRRNVEFADKFKKISSSKDAFDIMHPIMRDLPHEEFWILYLNNSNKVLKKEQHTKGGITGTLVDSRLILKKALLIDAVALIVAHNHPSGTLVPSRADKLLTNKLKNASETLDIKLLDHIIVTNNNYYSFADEGLM